MKNKKLLKEFRKVVREEYNFIAKPVKEHHYRELMFSISDDIDMNKNRNLIFRLLTLRDKIKIDINTSSISIFLDINSKNSSSKNSLSKSISSYNECINIEILKNIGCIIALDDKKVFFKDKSLYKDVIIKIKETSKVINKENFNFLYDYIMKNTGLARESNLDDILN